MPLSSRPSGPWLATSVIAVGVGLAAMVFALADPALQALPYVDADRLVQIAFGLPSPGAHVNSDDMPTLQSWQGRTDLFDGVAAFRDQGWIGVRISDRIVPLRAVAVTDNLLQVLGAENRFTDSDPAAASISIRAATMLSAEELQPGRSVPIVPAGVLHVANVLPRSFLLPEVDRMEPVDVLTNLPAGPVIKIEGMSSQMLNIVARLRAGVTSQTVEAALNVVMAPFGRRVSVTPFPVTLNARLRALAIGALLASCLVMVVCWTNIFSMSVTRGLYRAPELATRTALGATSSRIVRLFTGESLKVALWGAGTALAVAWLALRAALPVLPPQFAALGTPSVTGRVLLFVGVGGIFAGASWWVASTLAWKFGAMRQIVHVASRDDRTIRIVRFVLIGGQLTAVTVLLIGSALLGRSYQNLMNVDSGLDDHTETLTLVHDPNISPALRRDVVERTLSAFRRSGVAAAGASFGSVLDGRANSSLVAVDGHWLSSPVDVTVVAGDYFAAMGSRFTAGGPPKPGTVDAAVITESAARQLFGAGTAIGAVLSRDRVFNVVGVVRDVRSRRLSVPPKPGVYLQGGGWTGSQPQTTYVLRLADTSVGVASLERVVRTVDPFAVVLDSGSIGERLDRSVRDRTFTALVVALFSFSSLFVALLGLSGVVAYTVVKRTREIAIRLVLGATLTSVTELVVREALAAATCGVIGGVIMYLWLSRVLESLLYGIRAADPRTILFTAAGLLVTVLASAALPALRAGRVPAAAALRIE